MKEHGHRRVHSHDNIKPEETNKSSDVERVNCECCGMAEDCTPTYISRVRDNFYGKWLCGLCIEAVQEKKRKYHMFNNEQALEAHMTICKQFNKKNRVNPNLSLADAMANFARKRSQLRESSRAPAMARTLSCGPWIHQWTELLELRSWHHEFYVVMKFTLILEGMAVIIILRVYVICLCKRLKIDHSIVMRTNI